MIPMNGDLRAVRAVDPSVQMQTFSSSWETVREAAGVSCRFHDLRHTVATKMAEAGVPESTILALLGRMSHAMLERYSHIRMAAKREAVKSLQLPSLNLEAKDSAKGSHQAKDDGDVSGLDSGATLRDRTGGLLITNQPLYQLS